MISLKYCAILVFATSLGLALANPTPLASDLQKRGAVLSGQYASESEANGCGISSAWLNECSTDQLTGYNRRFVLANNLWGEAAATSGSQTTQVTSVNGNTVAWHTTYNWVGGPYSVKSYANLDLLVGVGKTLAAIKSIPVTWQWTYTAASSNLVADVSFDLWLSKSAGTYGASSSSTYEVMIWLSARGGAGPAGSQIATANINGINFKLFKGTVSSWTVFSFVAPSEITNFNSDLKPFFTYLTSSQGVSSSQFLVAAQAGTEPFTGSATLTTNAFALAIN